MSCGTTLRMSDPRRASRGRIRPFALRRQELGAALDRAAVRLRLSPRYLRALELGRVPLTPAIAQRMAAEYETSIGELTRPAAAGGARSGRRVSGNARRPRLE